MPRGMLSQEDRLRIQVTKLTTSVARLRSENHELKLGIKQRDQKIAALEARLQDKESQRRQLLSYLYKPNKEEQTSKPLGKKLGSNGYHRPQPKPSEVTEQKTYSLNQCPICRHPVGKAVDTVVKYEEDIVLTPRKTVKEYTITRHWCGTCETFVKAQDIPPISRIGIKVMGYILYARYRLRLPFKKIKQSLKDLHDFDISEGEIQNELLKAQTLFGKDYEMIIEFVKTADIVYADETGWRMNGQNWWLWVFVTEQGIRFVIDDSRGKGVPQDVLGNGNINRILITDFYAAYHQIPGKKQKCWVHLLRDAKWIGGKLNDDLKHVYHELTLELAKPKTARDSPRIRDQLYHIAQASYPEPEARKLQNRITKYIDELLTCIQYEGVLPENNTAERAIRPQVVMRKIFGGSRSLEGAQAHAVNTSVIATKLQQTPDFFSAILPLLEQRRKEQYEQATQRGE